MHSSWAVGNGSKTDRVEVYMWTIEDGVSTRKAVEAILQQTAS
jgi:hypothetical protein